MFWNVCKNNFPILSSDKILISSFWDSFFAPIFFWEGLFPRTRMLLDWKLRHTRSCKVLITISESGSKKLEVKIKLEIQFLLDEKIPKNRKNCSSIRYRTLRIFWDEKINCQLWRGSACHYQRQDQLNNIQKSILLFVWLFSYF